MRGNVVCSDSPCVANPRFLNTSALLHFCLIHSKAVATDVTITRCQVLAYLRLGIPSMRFLFCMILSFSSTLPAAAGESSSRALEFGELKLQGRAIKSVTLIKAVNTSRGVSGPLSGKKYENPEQSLKLAPGRYRVKEVQLEGGFAATRILAQEDDWFEVEPGDACRLKIGVPLSPRVSVNRHGQYLKMEYTLIGSGGREYRSVNHPSSSATSSGISQPRFSVYQDGQLLGSAAFEYG